jgi:hypothetical protein
VDGCHNNISEKHTWSIEKIVRLSYFTHSEVEIPRIRHGSKQTLDTLINEEALLLAKYLRNERQTWIPRISEA